MQFNFNSFKVRIINNVDISEQIIFADNKERVSPFHCHSCRGLSKSACRTYYLIRIWSRYLEECRNNKIGTVKAAEESVMTGSLYLLCL